MFASWTPAFLSTVGRKYVMSCERAGDAVSWRASRSIAPANGERTATHPVARELAVDAHEHEREDAPARVLGAVQRAVVPHRLGFAHGDRLAELAQLELDQRVRRLPVA